jgi:hypothetical protein
MKSRVVRDPQGTEWRLTIEWAVADTDVLKRVIAASGKTFRKPHLWERGQARFGMKPSGGLGTLALRAVLPATRWERDHS